MEISANAYGIIFARGSDKIVQNYIGVIVIHFLTGQFTELLISKG